MSEKNTLCTYEYLPIRATEIWESKCSRLSPEDSSNTAGDVKHCITAILCMDRRVIGLLHEVKNGDMTDNSFVAFY